MEGGKDETSQSEQDQPSSDPSSPPCPELQGAAMRALLSVMTNEPLLDEVKSHQAATLKELAQLKNGLAAMNKQSAEEYSKQAPDYMKAAHLARQVKTDLNDITKRISSIKKMLATLQSQQTEGNPHTQK